MGNCISSRARDDNADALEPTTDTGRTVTPNLKKFTFKELKLATQNFHRRNFLEEGAVGTVYKGWLNRSTYTLSNERKGVPVAVKKLYSSSHRGLTQWQAEVDFLGKLSHPNLVKLIGYFDNQLEYMLVYEYMPMGSLATHLFDCSQPLPWSIRIKIAIGAAQGLAFLHTTEPALIYRAFKLVNILLDKEFNAKLSSFGLARLVPTNELFPVGYTALEYINSGRLYPSSDVYGFGAVLLELVTGLRVFDANRPVKERNLVLWLTPDLHDRKNIRKIMDGRLADDYPLNGAKKMAKLILRCVEECPNRRPSMEQVLVYLQDIEAITSY